jgi:hypothetical protein
MARLGVPRYNSTWLAQASSDKVASGCLPNLLEKKNEFKKSVKYHILNHQLPPTAKHFACPSRFSNRLVLFNEPDKIFFGVLRRFFSARADEAPSLMWPVPTLPPTAGTHAGRLPRTTAVRPLYHCITDASNSASRGRSSAQVISTCSVDTAW